MKMIRVKQVKSGIGNPERQKRTLTALGLNKMHKTVELEANPAIMGMIRKVEHLVQIEEVK